VDPAIITGFRARLLQTRPAQTQGELWSSYVDRLFDITAASSGEDGAAYIKEVQDTVSTLDSIVGQVQTPVQERAVGRVLTQIRDGRTYLHSRT
jgi:hypothetical protein